MKITKTVASVFLTFFMASPLFAQSTFVDDFLRRYTPPTPTLGTAALQAQTQPVALVSAGLQSGALPITMQDVINLMLDHNLDIQSNRYSPRSSYFSSLVFFRSLQPSIRFSGTISRDTSFSNSQLNGVNVSRLSTLRDNFAVNFSQALPWGTSLAVDATMNRTSSNAAFSTFNPGYTGTMRYTVGQHVLRDRGKLVNMRQIRQGENNLKISETQFEIQVTNLVVQAQKAYWDLVFATEDMKVKQKSYELAQQTLRENETKVEIGTMAPIDVVQTRTEVATRRDAIVTSTSSITQTEDQIKKLISNQADPGLFLLKLNAQEGPRRPGSVRIPTLDEAIQIALENRPEIRQTMLELQNRDIDVAYTANQRLPILDITATYTQNGTGGTRTLRQFGSNEVLQIIPGGVWSAFGQLFGYEYTGSSIGFSLTIPLSNKAAKADHDRAITEKQLTQSRLNATKQAIMAEVRSALVQVEANRAHIETTQLTHELARQRMEAERTKYDLGTSTLRFVLEEQNAVAQAETNEKQSLVNFTKSLVDLDRAMGMTLRNNNIEIEKALQSPAVASKGASTRSGN